MKVEVKLQGLGHTVAPAKYPEPTVAVTEKPKTVYPCLTVNSKQFKGVGGLALDDKCDLVFRAKVKSTRHPQGEWEKRDSGLTDDDAIVEFELIEGGLNEPEIQNKGKAY